MKICTCCKIERHEDQYISKAGRILKTCQRCRDRKTPPKKCVHDKRATRCMECGGSELCQHGRQKRDCKECTKPGDGRICIHNRRKDLCKEGGTGYCEHDKMKSNCSDCGGSRICPCGKRKSSCSIHGGSAICEHGIHKQGCLICEGTNTIKCIHDVRKVNCKKCANEPKKILIKRMISHSRETDKKHNRYDADRFIDKCFIESLIDESMYCYYCKKEMQIIEYNDDICTIERLDNNIGHIKSNCVLACRGCNNRHQ